MIDLLQEVREIGSSGPSAELASVLDEIRIELGEGVGPGLMKKMRGKKAAIDARSSAGSQDSQDEATEEA